MRFCLSTFGLSLLLPDMLLHLRVDNRVAMPVINGFTSRSPALMAELRRLHVVVAVLALTLKATWLPSVANGWADALSRMRDSSDFRIGATLAARLDRLFGVPTVDPFASATNTLCARFFSRAFALGCEGADAFSEDWGGAVNLWIYPPLSDAGRVVETIRADGATETVVLPVWQAQPWWGDAVAAAQQAFLLPNTVCTFTLGDATQPVPQPKWRKAIFRFVAGGRSVAPPAPGRCPSVPPAGLPPTAGPRLSDMATRRLRHQPAPAGLLAAAHVAPPGAASIVGWPPVPAPAEALMELPQPSSQASP